MSKFKKKKKGMPAVNTASLPDIVFMLLFFFMVTTTMRETSLQIEAPRLPSAEKYGTAYNRIQLNDKIATPEDVPSFILRAREEVSEGEIPFMTTSIKADKESSVGTITDIRIKLRDVNALKLSYSTQTGADN